MKVLLDFIPFWHFDSLWQIVFVVLHFAYYQHYYMSGSFRFGIINNRNVTLWPYRSLECCCSCHMMQRIETPELTELSQWMDTDLFIHQITGENAGFPSRLISFTQFISFWSPLSIIPYHLWNKTKRLCYEHHVIIIYMSQAPMDSGSQQKCITKHCCCSSKCKYILSGYMICVRYYYVCELLSLYMQR